MLLLTVLVSRPPLGIALLVGTGFGAARAAPLLLQLVAARTGAAPRGTVGLAATPATVIVLLGGLTLV